MNKTHHFVIVPILLSADEGDIVFIDEKNDWFFSVILKSYAYAL